MKLMGTDLPKRLPDSDGPVFGRADGIDIPEKKRRLREIARHQLETVAQKKREEILQKIKSQRKEQEMLGRTKEQ